MALLSVREKDDGEKDLCCPHCGQGWPPYWDTEYGDPLSGTYDVHFPCCNVTASVTVEVKTSYTVTTAK